MSKQSDLVRLMMATESNDKTPSEGDQTPNDQANDEQVSETSRSQASLLADLQKERARRKEAEDQIAAQEAAREAAERQSQEAAGEWKKLYESERKKNDSLRQNIHDLQKSVARVETLESVIKQSNEQMLEEIPEEARKVLPLDHLPPEIIYAYMPEWVKQYAPPPPVNIGVENGEVNPGEKAKPKLTPFQQAAYDMGNWESEEAYLKQFEQMAVNI